MQHFLQYLKKLVKAVVPITVCCQTRPRALFQCCMHCFLCPTLESWVRKGLGTRLITPVYISRVVKFDEWGWGGGGGGGMAR